MEFGVGLDGTLQLSYAEQGQLSAEAAKLGYTQVWTPEGNGEDSFQLCAMRWAATRDVIPGGVTTGIGVSPVPLRTPMGFAMSAGTLSKMTGGRFILGIGSGQADVPNYRRTWNMRGTSTIGLMRDYVTTIRALVRGETVDYEGPSVTYHGARLSIDPPPRTPVYLAALGPNMTTLAGEWPMASASTGATRSDRAQPRARARRRRACRPRPLRGQDGDVHPRLRRRGRDGSPARLCPLDAVLRVGPTGCSAAQLPRALRAHGLRGRPAAHR